MALIRKSARGGHPADRPVRRKQKTAGFPQPQPLQILSESDAAFRLEKVQQARWTHEQPFGNVCRGGVFVRVQPEKFEHFNDSPIPRTEREQMARVRVRLLHRSGKNVRDEFKIRLRRRFGQNRQLPEKRFEFRIPAAPCGRSERPEQNRSRIFRTLRRQRDDHFDRSGVAAADERRRMAREPSGDFPRVMIDAAFFSGFAVTCFHSRAERADVLSAVSRQIRFRYEIAGDFPDAPRPGEKRKALQLLPEIMEHVRRCHRKGQCFMVFQRFYYKI